MEKSYDWFVQRRKTKGLDLAHEEIARAFDTVTWLNKATKAFSEKNFKDAKKFIENLYETEAGVDKLRTQVFMELSTGTALLADYREDLLHLVKRADTLADHTKDVARCLEMLWEVDIPLELSCKAVLMTSKLVDMVNVLSSSVEKISSNPTQAIKEAKVVEDIEHTIDEEYLNAKSLFVKYGATMNKGAIIIFDDLVEFLENAADMCADTADYIYVLSSRE
jgi:predicted phosphate transport protein (TIGR00153 family)